MIIVCGPSRVGKTTGIHRFVEKSREWEHAIASKIIENNGNSVSELSASAAYSNQQCIRETLIKTNCAKTILDGHLLVPLVDGFILVGPEIFQSLGVSDIIFVCPPADSAADASSTVKASEMLVSIENTYSEWMANALHSRHHVITSDKFSTNDRLSATLAGVQVTIENELS